MNELGTIPCLCHAESARRTHARRGLRSGRTARNTSDFSLRFPEHAFRPACAVRGAREHDFVQARHMYLGFGARS